ncbi:cell division protein FtsZ [Aurantiacibacter gangjinensis]|uniref:Cell division protein FtsZ n=1 Tax=Aurantiacibacter gangjinensis TaxID=502682 RepID=A0A0G9MRS5_9SPHN|nr:cell division protein FtsZ [Aurantiacibacter gangjinensis]APE27001.1 Cell division protein FtsZ [Aurantiacibacter gangjinensis]KLE33446.1 cell division protein FtsZ [Aurantiacibacter gangjinensis]
MSINIGPPSVEELRPRITVIGVGGAGGNAIANMIEAEIEGVDFIVANTDAQALNSSSAEHRIQLGPDITQGLGAGSRPEVGRAAAEETVEEIERALEGVNMVFIAAGMGGGTGTGAAPVIAQVARDRGILTVGVVTKPFLFEGTRRMRSAESGIEELQKHVDTLIVIPNQNLFLVAKAETTFKEAFMLADEVLQQGVRSITDLMVMPGLINLDFADVRSVMGEMGKAMMGTGEGEGDNRALEAAEHAIANPLLDGVSMQGAKGVIISIIGGEDMKLLEVDEAANHIRELVDPEANIIWGSAFNPELDGKIRVSVVATGIEQTGQLPQENARPLDLSTTRGPRAPALAIPADDGMEEQAPELTAEDDEPLDLGGDMAADEPADDMAEPELTAPADDSTFGVGSDDGYGADEPEPADEDERAPVPPVYDDTAADLDAAMELTDEAPAEEPATVEPTAEDEPPQDELLLDASRLAEADEPVQPQGGRRARMLGGGGDDAAGTNDPDDGPSGDNNATPTGSNAGSGSSGGAGGGGGAAAGGSTLFERMANLSRQSPSDDDDDDDDDEDGGSMRIPRFLGRQNNQ